MSLDGKRVYIPGHTGMVGSALVEQLAKNRNVTLLTVPRAALDLRNQQHVDDFFAREKPQVVIMAAGVVGGIIENRDYPGDFISDNLTLQLNLMVAARRHGVAHFIFLASSCMYPQQTHQPMAESQLLTGPLESTSQAYAVAKLAGLQMCLAFNRQDGCNRFIPLIPNTIYGPKDNFDPASGHVLPALISRFIQAKQDKKETITLWGSGRPVREFIHVDDVVAAIVLILKQPPEILQPPYNIGYGEGVSIAALATKIAAVVGFSGTLVWDSSKPDGAPEKVLDGTRLQQLGWQRQISLEEGIVKSVAWFREQQLIAG
ncbi:MAG: GDP-L-fucose synthase [Gammaproteobacteria bacterium]|nr:GDP-L-fucose synthase [Gammaproteobacteria bacterium]MCF6230167.1 GDP-L-fucose synthase [Gammaproteobacteria bacterium]